jgi:hypothetical protein
LQDDLHVLHIPVLAHAAYIELLFIVVQGTLFPQKAYPVLPHVVAAPA